MIKPIFLGGIQPKYKQALAVEPGKGTALLYQCSKSKAETILCLDLKNDVLEKMLNQLCSLLRLKGAYNVFWHESIEEPLLVAWDSPYSVLKSSIPIKSLFSPKTMYPSQQPFRNLDTSQPVIYYDYYYYYNDYYR